MPRFALIRHGSIVSAVFCTLVFLTSNLVAQSKIEMSRPTAGNAVAGKGRVGICKEIDDNWKCVGESTTWVANQFFNVLFENPTPVGVDFIGIVFHKQDSSGKDVEFVTEYQQQMDEKDRKYATVGDNFRLPVGTYSVYIISWGKRETLVHNGTLTDYFAKMTLTVK